MALGLPDDPAQQRRVLLALVPLVALFAYWYFLHDGYVEELAALETRLEMLEARNAQARARAPQSQELEERLRVFERHMVRLEELVPRSEEVSQLLNTIAERADQIGVDVTRFTPGQTDVGQHYNRRTFQMNVQGEFHDIGRFLSTIGSLPRIITPTQLQMGPAQDWERSQELGASFLIETYVLPEPGTTAVPGGEPNA